MRYGVAPDHEKITSLQGNLRTVLEDPRGTFLGHVRVGDPGLSPRQSRELYHAVVPDWEGLLDAARARP